MPTTLANLHWQTCDVRIDRTTKFGNPFKIGPDGDREQVIKKYRAWIMKHAKLIEATKCELTGKVLGCWCYPLPCHGDVLVEICDKR